MRTLRGTDSVVRERAQRALLLGHLEQEPLLHLSPGAWRWRVLLTGQVLGSLSSARGGGTERLPPPHSLLLRAQPSRIPEQRRQQTPAASQLGAAEKADRGRRHREGTWPGAARISCAQLVSTGRIANRSRKRGDGGKGLRELGRPSEGKKCKLNFAILCLVCTCPGAIQSRSHPSTRSWGTVGVKAGARGRSAPWLMLADH